MALNDLLRLVSPGDTVTASSVNTPLQQLNDNTRYLLDLFKAAGSGSTLYARSVIVDSSVVIGTPVYFNNSSQKFLPAISAVEVKETTGEVVMAESAHAWGIIAKKHSSELADILLSGIASIDITAAVSDTSLQSGTYYLSSVTPGKLTATKSANSTAILKRMPDGQVFVSTQVVDHIDRHSHRKFSLRCVPAGTHSPPAEDGLHSIADADASEMGWLPADHSVFNGKAPPGAVFGYNITAHAALAAAWPPVPITNVELAWNKGLSKDVGFTGVPLGSGGLAIVDRHGIWWMSNCYGDVPWPINYDSMSSSSYSDSVGSECPRVIPMELDLFFTKVNFATDSTVVLSLRSNSARLKLTCYGTDTERNTGDLVIDLDLNFVVSNGQEGYLAFKEFDPKTTTFRRGLVAEGLYSASANVSLTSSETTTRPVGEASKIIHHGLVGIAVDPADTKELEVQLVRLAGAEQAYYGNPPVMYLEFSAGDIREYRGKIDVPNDLVVPNPEMKLRFAVLGRAAGTLPQLQFTYRLVPTITGLLTAEDLPNDSSEQALTCDTEAILTDSDQYVIAESESFAVAPGDTVFFSVRRLASDGYGSEVGILRHNGIIVQGA
jgi:hypothetical protein